MTTMNLLKKGISMVRRTKRMVFFSWFVNLSLALTFAFPLRNQLDDYLRTSGMEETILTKMNDLWFQTYKYDHQQSEIARMVNISIFGYAPFLFHTDAVLRGFVVTNVGTFLSDLVFGFRLNSSPFGLLLLLAVLYSILGSYLAGAFIGMYARESRSSFQDFLVDGAKYFGRFFRLSLLSVIVLALFFAYIMSNVNSSIVEWTRNEPSEMTPFTYYMVRNVVFFFLLAVFMMSLDYAKIRIVVDDRLSSILAFFAGFRFAFRNFRKTFGLYLALMIFGLIFVALYSWLEAQFSQDVYWEILFIALLQQMYMLAYFWLKANFFASQTSLYQDALKTEHRASIVS